MSSQTQSSDSPVTPLLPPGSAEHRAAVINALKRLGADRYDMLLPETRSLPGILVAGEALEGVVYGRYRQTDKPAGRGVLVATDRRVILIDHKPLFLSASEISYDVVSGVAQSRTGFMDTVTLSTRMGNVSIRTFNRHCAASFVHAIEVHIFSRPADFRAIHF